MHYELRSLSGGYSGAELYHVTISGSGRPKADPEFAYLDRLSAGNYCLKILHPSMSADRLDRIQSICEVYQSLGIPSLRLFQHGLTPGGRCYCIYNYIDGENFEIAGEKLSGRDNYRVGAQVGTWLRQLQSTPAPSSLVDRTPDLDQLTTEAQGFYHRLRSHSVADSLLREYFSSDLLDSIPARLDQGLKSFRGLQPHLIHGDVKRSNLMRDSSGQIYLIDIEAMRPSYDSLNFRYQMAWLLSGESATKPEFVRGLFDGLYENSRPAYFQDQLVYILLFNFLEYSSKHLDDTDSPNEIKAFFGRLQPVLPKALNSTSPII